MTCRGKYLSAFYVDFLQKCVSCWIQRRAAVTDTNSWLFTDSVNISFSCGPCTVTDLGKILSFNHLKEKGKKTKNKNPYGIAQLSRGWWWCCCCCRCCKLTSVLSAVPVADIKAVITGKDCPHMKEKGALKQNKVCVCVWTCAHTCTCTCACVWAGGCVSRRENEFLCMRELHNEDVGYIISL